MRGRAEKTGRGGDDLACDGDWVVQEEGENDGEGKAGDGEEGGAARDRPAVKRVDGGGAVGGV
jgi:hypothetical protein